MEALPHLQVPTHALVVLRDKSSHEEQLSAHLRLTGPLVRAETWLCCGLRFETFHKASSSVVQAWVLLGHKASSSVVQAWVLLGTRGRGRCHVEARAGRRVRPRVRPRLRADCGPGTAPAGLHQGVRAEETVESASKTEVATLRNLNLSYFIC